MSHPVDDDAVAFLWSLEATLAKVPTVSDVLQLRRRLLAWLSSEQIATTVRISIACMALRHLKRAAVDAVELSVGARLTAIVATLQDASFAIRGFTEQSQLLALQLTASDSCVEDLRAKVSHGVDADTCRFMALTHPSIASWSQDDQSAARARVGQWENAIDLSIPVVFEGCPNQAACTFAAEALLSTLKNGVATCPRCAVPRPLFDLVVGARDETTSASPRGKSHRAETPPP